MWITLIHIISVVAILRPYFYKWCLTQLVPYTISRFEICVHFGYVASSQRAESLAAHHRRRSNNLSFGGTPTSQDPTITSVNRISPQVNNSSPQIWQSRPGQGSLFPGPSSTGTRDRSCNWNASPARKRAEARLAGASVQETCQPHAIQCLQYYRFQAHVAINLPPCWSRLQYLHHFLSSFARAVN